MFSKKIQKALNDQIQLEEQSSRIYMAMASWCEANGYAGAAGFLFMHSDEERMHMTKLLGYVNDKGGHALLQALEMPHNDFSSLQHVFEEILRHEELVSASINNIYDLTLKEKDYTTGQFLQWYIMEQIEEESLFRSVLDKFKLAGDQKGGLFHIDKELASMANAPSAKE
ncbi:MAG: ferritin [Bacteroidales bacterium]|nr:ferritin [Bacteroidales bacterium]